MAILQIILSAILMTWVAADDSCPGAAEISPCTCDGEGMNCMKAKTVDQVKNAFNAHFKYGGVRGVWLQGTPITNIPKGVFGNIKIQQLYIELNNISSIDFQAFSASYKTLRILSCFGNKLNAVDFKKLSEFKSLQVVNMGRNQITEIPESAFNSQSISTIFLSQNNISKLGENAFSALPNLMKLELSSNKITTLGVGTLAFTGHSPSLQIYLVNNQLSSISKDAFKGAAPLALHLSHNRLTSLPPEVFVDLVTIMGQKGGFIELSNNPLSCKGCDYSWIVTNQKILKDVIHGFMCIDGKSMQDLSKVHIQCSN